MVRVHRRTADQKEEKMTYVITAEHPWFSEPLVMERGFPFTERSAEAWVFQYLIRAFPNEDWFLERNNVTITLSTEE